ncbi:MAG: SURF1 family protein [Alphaproteobacteria bacterium]|nr:SURF1 family protein [Alphaproteobacteria bacterium]
MHFRPFPVLTIIAVPALAALIWLGVWQAGRAGWKAGEIAAFEQRIKTPPLTLEKACAEGLATSQISVPPAASGPELRVFGHRTSGDPGWRHFQVTDICGHSVLVETGFDALEIGGPGGVSPKPPAPQVAPERFIVTPWPDQPFMAAPNTPERNEWSWFDAPAMAKALGEPALNTKLVVLPLEGMPDYVVRTPPETHIGYAVTWFGMAIAFALIYGLMHARAGRLRFGKAPSVKAKGGKAGE